MDCPICKQEASKIWESMSGINGGQCFTGLYICHRCGHFKACGTIRNDIRKVVQWHPSCPTHGPDKVLLTMSEHHDFATMDTEWICSACNRKMRVEGNRLVTTWRPRNGEPVPVVDASLLMVQETQRMGGLPHD